MHRSDFEFGHSLRVRYAECDAQQIVFNAHYLTYFDVAVTEFFRHRGFNYTEFVKQQQIDFHVIRSEIDYKVAARFDDVLEVCVKPELKAPRIIWQVAIFKDQTLMTRGVLHYVIINTATGRPQRKVELGFIG